MFWQVAGLTELGNPSQCCPELPDAEGDKVGPVEGLADGFGETLGDGFDEETCDFGDVEGQVGFETKTWQFLIEFSGFSSGPDESHYH